MPVERTVGGTSLIDVLDRVLDKGIVIDAWVRVSLVGIDLITVEARIVVASIDTYLKYSEAVGQVGSVAKPTALEPVRAALLKKIREETEQPGMGPEALRTNLARMSPADLAGLAHVPEAEAPILRPARQDG